MTRGNYSISFCWYTCNVICSEFSIVTVLLFTVFWPFNFVKAELNMKPRHESLQQQLGMMKLRKVSENHNIG